MAACSLERSLLPYRRKATAAGGTLRSPGGASLPRRILRDRLGRTSSALAGEEQHACRAGAYRSLPAACWRQAALTPRPTGGEERSTHATSLAAIRLGGVDARRTSGPHATKRQWTLEDRLLFAVNCHTAHRNHRSTPPLRATAHCPSGPDVVRCTPCVARASLPFLLAQVFICISPRCWARRPCLRTTATALTLRLLSLQLVTSVWQLAGRGGRTT